MFTPAEEGKALHLRCPSGGRSGGECQAQVALSAWPGLGLPAASQLSEVGPYPQCTVPW